MVDNLASHINRHTSSLTEQAAVAIFLPRNVSYLAAIFATWRTGNYYIPLNKEWPETHTRKILDHLKPDLIISDTDDFSSYCPILKPPEVDFASEPAAVPDQPVQRKLKDDDLAYIIYTSGSTGDQKGVMIYRRSLETYIDWMKRDFAALANCKKLLINGELTFDISVADFAFALAHDLEIHVTPSSSNLFATLKMITARQIDSLYAVPSTLNNICNWFASRDGVGMEHISHVFSGGDVLNLSLIKRLTDLSPDARIYNMYGPTEATMNCLSIRVDDKLEEITANKAVPTGRLPAHIRGILLPLDNSMAQNNTGELIVAGDQLMAGYLNDEQKTSDAFMQVDGVSYYKTGDFFRKDGDVFHYLDRADSLVKIKGYRINLSDITDLLCSEDAVADARVVAVSGTDGEQKILVAFFVSISGVDVEDTVTHLTNLCKQTFPAYMVPSKFLPISAFPLGKTGKHDLNILRQKAATELQKSYD